MGFFEKWFGRPPTTEYDPKTVPLADIAAILSHNDREAVADIRQMLADPQAFAERYEHWLAAFDFSPTRDAELILAYFLVGYETPYEYGGYFDWKVGADEVVQTLAAVFERLGISLDFDRLVYGGSESPETMFVKIDKLLVGKGYTLMCWNTQSDSYHVFPVPLAECRRLFDLGNAAGISFYRFDRAA